MRYLQGTKDHMFTYKRSDHLEMIRYSNSNFSECMDTRKSFLRYVFPLARGTILWRSAKQFVVATSTMEAKFIACFAARI